MGLNQAIEISKHGMSVQRMRMQLVASNIANASTTETPEGGPYRRRQLVVESMPLSPFDREMDVAFQALGEEGPVTAKATRITLDPSPFRVQYEPEHPQADANGYVAYPNINPAIEMVDMVNISRSYQANLAAIRASREMILETIDLLRT